MSQGKMRSRKIFHKANTSGKSCRLLTVVTRCRIGHAIINSFKDDVKARALTAHAQATVEWIGESAWESFRELKARR